jgi:hypothetical protein
METVLTDMPFPQITPLPILVGDHIPGKKPRFRFDSDWHGGWIVPEQTEVVSASSWAEFLRIGTLQRVCAFSRMDLHGIGTLLARLLVTQQSIPSSIAMTAPWPRKGDVGCAASPSVETRPRRNRPSFLFPSRLPGDCNNVHELVLA